MGSVIDTTPPLDAVGEESERKSANVLGLAIACTHQRTTPAPPVPQTRPHCNPTRQVSAVPCLCAVGSHLAVLMMTPRSCVDSSGLGIGLGASRTSRAAVKRETLKDPTSCESGAFSMRAARQQHPAAPADGSR